MKLKNILNEIDVHKKLTDQKYRRLSNYGYYSREEATRDAREYKKDYTVKIVKDNDRFYIYGRDESMVTSANLQNFYKSKGK